MRDNTDKENLLTDLQILKDFILGFTSRDTDKEWQAFRRVTTQIEVLEEAQKQIDKLRQQIENLRIANTTMEQAWLNNDANLGIKSQIDELKETLSEQTFLEGRIDELTKELATCRELSDLRLESEMKALSLLHELNNQVEAGRKAVEALTLCNQELNAVVLASVKRGGYGVTEAQPTTGMIRAEEAITQAREAGLI